jgi:hypothetical protein
VLSMFSHSQEVHREEYHVEAVKIWDSSLPYSYMSIGVWHVYFNANCSE